MVQEILSSISIAGAVFMLWFFFHLCEEQKKLKRPKIPAVPPNYHRRGFDIYEERKSTLSRQQSDEIRFTRSSKFS